MHKIFQSISEAIYPWVMDTRADDYKFFQNGHDFHNGLEYITIALFAAALLFCLYFYFVQARDIVKATRKEYLAIFGIGFFTMVVVDFVLMATVAEYRNVLSSGNMWKITLVNVLYYIVLYQVFSWLFKGMSRVPNIDLIKCFF